METVARRNATIIMVSCFTLNLAMSLVHGTLPHIIMWMHQGDTIDYSVIKLVLGAAPMIIPVIAILIGLSIGKTGDVDRAYGRYVTSLFIGGLATGATPALVYLLVQDDSVKVVMEVGAIYSVTGLLDVAGCIFSGIALAWFYTSIYSKPSLVTKLAKGVALYQFWIVLKVAVLKLVWLTNAGISSELMVYASNLSLINVPLSLIYLYFLYWAGTRIDMKGKYLDVVYTLMVLEILGAVVAVLVSRIGYDLDLVDIIWTGALRIVISGLGVLGARFALVSYGYFRSASESKVV